MESTAFASAPNNAPASAVRFPNTVSKDLTGTATKLPTELPGERSVVLVAFQREQQHDIDGWVAGLHLEDGKTPWVELPVIDNPGAIGRWFIDNGMRRGISNHETWKHVITLYINKKNFMRQVGLTTETVVHALVVDREGRILLSLPGAFTPKGAEQIAAVMRGDTAP